MDKTRADTLIAGAERQARALYPEPGAVEARLNREIGLLHSDVRSLCDQLLTSIPDQIVQGVTPTVETATEILRALRDATDDRNHAVYEAVRKAIDAFDEEMNSVALTAADYQEHADEMDQDDQRHGREAA
jgi:hypothetical protein